MKLLTNSKNYAVHLTPQYVNSVINLRTVFYSAEL